MPVYSVILQETIMFGIILYGGSFQDNLLNRFARDDLKSVLSAAQDIDAVKEIASTITEITYAGHSSANLLSKGHSITNHTPAELADSISKKYGQGDKTNLTDFYLASCEAGLKQENSPSFAEKFSREMFNRGFTSLQVHAICSPISDTPMTGMILETVGDINEEMKINSWGYKSTSDEARDKAINDEMTCLSAEKDKLTTKLGTQLGRLERTQTVIESECVTTALNELEQEQKGLRVPICNDVNYKEEMGQSYNTFVNGVQKARMCAEVSEAIIFLSDIKKRLPKAGNLKINQAINTLRASPGELKAPECEFIAKLKTQLPPKKQVTLQQKKINEWVDVSIKVKEAVIVYNSELGKSQTQNIFVKFLIDIGIVPDALNTARANKSTAEANQAKFRNENSALDSNEDFMNACKKSVKMRLQNAEIKMSEMKKDKNKEGFFVKLAKQIGIIPDPLPQAENAVKAIREQLNEVNNSLNTINITREQSITDAINNSVYSAIDTIVSASAVVGAVASAVVDAGAKIVGQAANKVANILLSPAPAPAPALASDKSSKAKAKDTVETYLQENSNKNKDSKKMAVVTALKKYMDNGCTADNWALVDTALNHLTSSQRGSSKIPEMVANVKASYPVQNNATPVHMSSSSNTQGPVNVAKKVPTDDVLTSLKWLENKKMELSEKFRSGNLNAADLKKSIDYINGAIAALTNTPSMERQDIDAMMKTSDTSLFGIQKGLSATLWRTHQSTSEINGTTLRGIITH